MSHGSHGGNPGDAFDDEPIEDEEAYAGEPGFDDQPLDYDPYADAEQSAPRRGFPGQEYDAPESRSSQSPALARIRRGSGGGGIAALLFVLFLLGTVPIAGVGVFFLMNPKKETVSVGPDGTTRIVVRESGAPTNVKWTDASTGVAQKIRDLSVKVTQVSMGRARGRDAANQVVFSGGEYVRVDLLIESFHRAPFEYVSWYGREVEQFSGPDRARLFDAEGAELTPHVFADVRDLEGTTLKATLELRDKVHDALYFDLPEGADVPAELGDLRLQIPLEGTQNDAAFRFLIPVSMIVRDADRPPLVDPDAPVDDEASP